MDLVAEFNGRKLEKILRKIQKIHNVAQGDGNIKEQSYVMEILNSMATT